MRNATHAEAVREVTRLYPEATKITTRDGALKFPHKSQPVECVDVRFTDDAGDRRLQQVVVTDLTGVTAY